LDWGWWCISLFWQVGWLKPYTFDRSPYQPSS
jgi:hypothetical protein